MSSSWGRRLGRVGPGGGGSQTPGGGARGGQPGMERPLPAVTPEGEVTLAQEAWWRSVSVSVSAACWRTPRVLRGFQVCRRGCSLKEAAGGTGHRPSPLGPREGPFSAVS